MNTKATHSNNQPNMRSLCLLVLVWLGCVSAGCTLCVNGTDGSVPMLTVTVTLTHAQVLALNTSSGDVIIVPGVTGEIIVLHRYMATSTVANPAFTGSTPMQLVYFNAGTHARTVVSTTPLAADLLFAHTHGIQVGVGAGLAYTPTIGLAVNQPIALNLVAGGTPFTGANLNKVLTVTAWYSLFSYTL